MKLRYSPTSPYVRKVMISAIELGLTDAIELVTTKVWDPTTDIGTDNPLGKVPTLVLDNGETLFDSPVICEYLDAHAGGGKIFPAVGPDRWAALRLQALGDGILDAALSRLLEGKRPPGEKSEAWIGRQKVAIERALQELESLADDLGQGISIGTITVGCALGYLDFRFAEDNWRADCPALADWFDIFAERPSFEKTTAQDPAWNLATYG